MPALTASCRHDTRSSRSFPRGPPPSRAKEILEERYASGELSAEEYRERLDHLR
ncbi:SHOCT domain-containing protein [Actinomarinicola tropica]|uniref:SHOCT domain-containing protein n=1 Tax=Actinomarinicola tropica TaxID=2789776 RepID=A0A5Q2RET1_9ACTN|nr:SHOCT domain-containing protein [Actinomarinicola tropica]QGG94173.1 hypothetical protein GH723_03130 [Actinomarinicola tropica]